MSGICVVYWHLDLQRATLPHRHSNLAGTRTHATPNSPGSQSRHASSVSWNSGQRHRRGALGAPLFVSRRALAAPGKPGANDRITVGAIGVGGRATLLLEQLPESAQIVALSDCNLPRAEAFKAKAGGDWPVYQDYRKILDRKDIDAVIVATGEFQRVVPCIHACQAGKDIYAEKPLTLYISEGRALVDAVRKHDRILQVGTQQRSMAMNRVACELVRSGGLGKVLEVRAINYAGPEASPAQLPAEQPVPAGLRLERVAQPGGHAAVSTATGWAGCGGAISPAAK